MTDTQILLVFAAITAVFMAACWMKPDRTNRPPTWHTRRPR